MLILEPISGAEEVGYSDWELYTTSPGARVKSALLEPQEPSGELWFLQEHQGSGHNKTVLVTVSCVLLLTPSLSVTSLSMANTVRFYFLFPLVAGLELSLRSFRDPGW